MKHLVFVLVVLAACGSPSRVVVMQHPETKQAVECRIDPLGSIDRGGQINACVSSYQQAGFKVVGDSN